MMVHFHQMPGSAIDFCCRRRKRREKEHNGCLEFAWSSVMAVTITKMQFKDKVHASLLYRESPSSVVKSLDVGPVREIRTLRLTVLAEWEWVGEGVTVAVVASDSSRHK